MDSYHKVVVPQKRNQENEIFVNSKSPASHLLSRVLALFKEKNFKEVTFRATGGAISTAVTVAELTKRRIEGLHQITTIGTTDVSSVFEPTIEGLEKHEQTRLVSSIVIRLSVDPLDSKTPGYQAPLSAAEFQAAQDLARQGRENAPRRVPRGPRPPRANQTGEESSSSLAPQSTEASSGAAPGHSEGHEGRRGGVRSGRGGRGGRGPRPPRDAPAGTEHTSSGHAPSHSAPNGEPRRGGPRRGRGGRGGGGRGGRGPRPEGAAAPSSATPQ